MEYVWYVIAALGAGIGTGLANLVKNRTAGIVTGAVLTVLGAVMLILNYWPILSQIAVISAER